MNPQADLFLGRLGLWSYLISATRDLGYIAATGKPWYPNPIVYTTMSWSRLQVPMPAQYLTNAQGWVLGGTTNAVQREFPVLIVRFMSNPHVFLVAIS